MGFWTAIFLIATIAIVTEFVLRIVKMGTRHHENIERIRHGYPTTDGKRAHGHEVSHDEFVSVNTDRLQ